MEVARSSRAVMVVLAKYIATGGAGHAGGRSHNAGGKTRQHRVARTFAQFLVAQLHDGKRKENNEADEDFQIMSGNGRINLVTNRLAENGSQQKIADYPPLALAMQQDGLGNVAAGGKQDHDRDDELGIVEEHQERCSDDDETETRDGLQERCQKDAEEWRHM